MPIYQAPLREMEFVLNELWEIDNVLANLSGFEEINSAIIHVVLEEAAKFNENILFPLNRIGDQQGCQFQQGEVKSPTGFKQAYQTYIENGWPSLTVDKQHGGQGFPHMVNMLVEEMLCSSNVAFSLCPSLTRGVYYAIDTHGSEELKRIFLPKLASGIWSGVMCLTEAHSGTDLGLLRTKAIPQPNGTYRITGTKIFITGGEHDLSENIIHLVLARLPNAPAGTKGISLFLVPKFLPDENQRNNVFCSAIEHKMGLKGSPTCVMNYEGATGYLLGGPNKGMQAMFTIMNLERVAIGLQGLGLAEVAYQNAVQYAKERLQGRAPQGTLYPDKPADPIIVHPDIRRLLLTIRAYNEAARALSVWVGMNVDIAARHSSEQQRQQADAMVQLFTPVVKAFFTDYGFEACNLALQIFGGHGYISEWGMEQFVRDARVAQIYEGTNAVQALDLVKRKLVANEGHFLQIFTEHVQVFMQECDLEFDRYVKPLKNALEKLKNISEWIILQSSRDPALVGAVATDYLHLLSLVVFAYLWVRMAMVAQKKTTQNKDHFYRTKQVVADFYLQKLLPRIEGLALSIRSGSEVLMKLAEKDF